MRLSGIRRIILITGAIAVALTLTALLVRRTPVTDPRLLVPDHFLAEIARPGVPAFVTPGFFRFLRNPGVMSLPTREESRSASLSPETFLKLHRKRRFAAAVIGSEEQNSPLLSYLLSSPAWVLAEIGPWGWVFRSSGTTAPWQLSDGTVWEKEWPHPSDRSLAMIRTAANLAAIHRDNDAEELLSKAAALQGNRSLLLSTRASMAAARSDWETASSFAGKSLKLDRGSTAAALILIRSLVETGHADEALRNSRDLLQRQPEDPAVLLLVARTANAAGSSEEEIDALERLVSVSRKNGQPVTVVISYLGQAYAKSGRRGDALRCFEAALADPSLDDGEKRVIREIMDHVSPDPAR